MSVVALVAGLPLGAPPARAQTPAAVPAAAAAAEAAPPEEPLVPPRLVAGSPPAYPLERTEAVTVVITVVVAPDGSVREVRALDGHAAFLEAARGAALRWQFEPARRGAKAIAATVRIAIDFAPSPTSPGPTSPSHPLPPQPLEEIVVRGTRVPPPASVNLGRADIRQMPGAMGDPLRAIEVLPGVLPTLSGLPYFYTRGAPPSATGYYLDDLPLPYLFHVGLGPSIIHPGFVRTVGLESAGGHARYGRFTGAFVVATSNPPTEELGWEGRIRVIDSSAFVAAPFANGKGHAAVGTTLSYAGLLLGVLAPDYTIDYRDFAARVSYDVGPRDRITIFSLGAYDFAGQRDVESGQRQVLFGSEVYRVDLKWQRSLAGDGALRTAVTWGYDRSRLAGHRFASDQSIAARTALVQPFGPRWEMEVGADARIDSFDADLPSVHSLTRADYEETARLFGAHTDTVAGSYGSLTWRPLTTRGPRESRVTPPTLELTSGVRTAVYSSEGRTLPAVDPRMSLVLAPASRVRLLTSHGLAHQAPAYSLPVPAVSIPALAGGLQESLQSSLTGEVTGPHDLVGTATVFRGVFSNVSDFVLLQNDFPLKRSPPLRGAADGLELSLRRALKGRFGAQVSYTLSRSTRDGERESRRLSSYDRRHVVNVALLFDLGRGWTAGARSLVYSGLLRDPESGSTDRLPAFMRLDVRLAKRWKWGKAGYVGLVAEGLNVTASRETVALRCDDAGCKARNIGPLTLPSVGIEGGM